MSDFDAVMAIATAQTQASQIALAQEVQAREVAERRQRDLEDRKERERAQREKERRLRAMEEERAKEARLAAERQARTLQRTAASVSSAALSSKRSSSAAPSQAPPGKSRTSASASHRDKTSSAPAAKAADPEEQRQLERQHKLARARAKLFDEDPPSLSSLSASVLRRTHSSSTGHITRRPVSHSSSKGKGKATGRVPQGTAPQTTRERLTSAFAADDLVALNQVKRDRRTIEEVELDMKRRREGPNAGSADLTPSAKPNGGFWDDPRMKNVASKNVVSTAGSGGGKSGSSKDADSPAAKVQNAAGRTAVAKEKERGRDIRGSPTVVDDAETRAWMRQKRRVGAALDDFSPAVKRVNLSSGLTSPAGRGGSGSAPVHSTGPSRHGDLVNSPSRRPRRSVSASEDEEDGFVSSDEDCDHGSNGRGRGHPSAAMRDEIWRIMGKDRSRYLRKRVYSDDDDGSGSSNMEAGAGDVLEEEGRAARLARLEDQREQEALKQHDAEKKRLAAARAAARAAATSKR